jgi:hypothetical protein
MDGIHPFRSEAVFSLPYCRSPIRLCGNDDLCFLEHFDLDVALDRQNSPRFEENAFNSDHSFKERE